MQPGPFCLSNGAVVFLAMWRAIRAVRERDFVAHRRFTAHVAAQLSVAVTSRALLVLFHLCGIDAELAYIVALWIPVVASALFVEFARTAPMQPKRRSSGEVAPVHLAFDPAR